MRKMSEAEVMVEISKASVFSNTYLKAHEDIKELFKKLASESSIYSCNKKGYAKNMAETGKCFSGGDEWHRFRISKDSDLPETLRLIKYCY